MTDAPSRPSPIRIVPLRPSRSDNHPNAGLAAYIPATCTLMTRPTTRPDDLEAEASQLVDLLVRRSALTWEMTKRDVNLAA